jgi:outer membrane protein
MKKLIVITMVITGLLFLGCNPVFAAGNNFKFGYIDLQKVMALSQQGGVAKQKMKARQEKLRGELQKRQAEIAKMKEELESQGMMLSPEKRQEKENDYQKKVRDFKIFVSDSEKEMKALQGEFLKKMLKDLEVVTGEFGKKNHYQLLLEKRSGIVYADPAYDVTDQLIKAYDQWVVKNHKNK